MPTLIWCWRRWAAATDEFVSTARAMCILHGVAAAFCVVLLIICSTYDVGFERTVRQIQERASSSAEILVNRHIPVCPWLQECVFVEPTETSETSIPASADPRDVAASKFRTERDSQVIIPSSSPDVLELCVTHSASQTLERIVVGEGGLLGTAGAIASGSWGWVKSGTHMVLSKVPRRTNSDGTPLITRDKTNSDDTIELPRPDFILRSTSEVSFAVRGLLIVHIVAEVIFILLSLFSATGTPFQASKRAAAVPMFLTLALVVSTLCVVLGVILYFAADHLKDVPEALTALLFMNAAVGDLSDSPVTRFWGNTSVVSLLEGATSKNHSLWDSTPFSGPTLGDYGCLGDCCLVVLQLHDTAVSIEPWVKHLLILEVVVLVAYISIFIILRYDPFGRDAEMTPDQYYYTWLRRLEIGCCCLNDKTDHRHRMFSEMAFSFTSLFQNHDLSILDHVAALALLSRHQRGLLARYRRAEIEESASLSTVQPEAITTRQVGCADNRQFDAANKLVLLKTFSRHISAVYGWSEWVSRKGCWVGCKELRQQSAKSLPSAKEKHHGDWRGYNHATLQLVLPDVAEEDYLFSHWSNDVMLPSFYVCVDRQHRAVVIAVRGTNSVYDLATDAVASSIPMDEETIFAIHSEFHRTVLGEHHDGAKNQERSTSRPTTPPAVVDADVAKARKLAEENFLNSDHQRPHGLTNAHPEPTAHYRVHTGMQESAENILRILKEEKILERIEEVAPKDFPVVVLGHSLGAGVAILLSSLLFAKYFERWRLPSAISGASSGQRDLRCLSYAAPGACMSQAAAELLDPIVAGCALSDDIVPRISPAGMSSLRISLCYCLAAASERKSEILDRFAQRTCCGFGPFEHLWDEDGLLPAAVVVDGETNDRLVDLLQDTITLPLSNAMALRGPCTCFFLIPTPIDEDVPSSDRPPSIVVAWGGHTSSQSPSVQDVVFSADSLRHHRPEVIRDALERAVLPSMAGANVDSLSRSRSALEAKLRYRPGVSIVESQSADIEMDIAA